MAKPVIEEYRLRVRQRPVAEGPGNWSHWTPRWSGGQEKYCALDHYDYQFRLVHDGRVIAGPVDVDPAKVRPGDPVDYSVDAGEDLTEGSMVVRLDQDFSDTIPVTVGGVGGRQIGSGVLNADGSFEATITDKEIAEKLAPNYTKLFYENGATRQVGGSHYQTGYHEPFLVIDEWGERWPARTMFFLGCAVKYIARIGRKGDAESWKQDLDKAIHYLQEAKKRI